ncbi:ferrochelatase [Pseudalkalibacillus hwajinpoensis]|uniref:Coproporphyrin III ferrochelatase n=1 Tax=Guptibacillus hwajinpoensis TaxID=208199 RepID=A0A4U1MER4_9BACL|nr:ferrochelatase [Pseudalkalibacillus hwajinpoensis]TKD68710.1 ferrochelatase [Pseudalkalibacillus hwajinpoensis]
MKKTIGLLVMAYGTPRSETEIEPYYTHIHRGKKPTDEMLQDLIDRYEAIGGISPSSDITKEQAQKLEDRMNEQFGDETIQFKSYLGLKHIEPFVEEAVRDMQKDGITEAVSIVLAPHYSTLSVKTYNERAKAEAEKLGYPYIYTIDQWYNEPKFIQYWVNQLQSCLSEMNEEKKKKTVVIFSAHSVPEKLLQDGDPYPAQLEETAKHIADRAGIKNYAIGWQSEESTPDPWIGPDIQDLTRDLFEQEGFTGFIYCPVGFVADHLEVLYDNDYECRQMTDELGAFYHRPEMPNATDEFIEILATVVTRELTKKKMISNE